MFLYKLQLNYITDQYIHTNIKLFTQQVFLQVPISICTVESVNNVSIMDSLAPTVHTSLRVEYTNHHTILFPFPLHPNTDTWCTSTSLSSLSHVLIHTLVKSLSPPFRMTHNSTKNCYAIIGSAGNSTERLGLSSPLSSKYALRCLKTIHKKYYVTAENNVLLQQQYFYTTQHEKVSIEQYENMLCKYHSWFPLHK